MVLPPIEAQTLILAAAIVVATGFLTRAGERLYEWANKEIEEIKRRRNNK
jgi:hypothetical protein